MQRIFLCSGCIILILLLGRQTNASEAGPESIYYQNAITHSEFRKRSDILSNTYSKKTPSRNKVLEGLSSSFSIPWDELYVGKHASEWRNILSGFSGGLSVGYPLTQSEVALGGEGGGDLAANNVTYSVSLKYKPLGSWFISTALIKYKDERLKRPWNPDFVYTFGYSDWRPYTLSLVYANYGGNRLDPDEGEKTTSFEQGSWTLGWKFPIPTEISRIFTFTEEGRLGCNVGYSVVRKYFDSASGDLLDWKQTSSFGCKYTIVGAWYFNMTAFYYPYNEQKQPWNPDYIYGFGYFDWRPGTITIQYNNYSGNRWPWHEKEPNTGDFESGGLMIAWSWSL